MKKFLFLIVFIFLCNCLFAQDTTKSKEKRKNNAIKGIVIPLTPSIAFFYLSNFISLGYERYFTQNNSLSFILREYTGNYTDNTRQTFNIILGYNRYIYSKYKFINNLWLNPFFKYTYFFSGGENYKIKTNNYGFGCSIGKRVYFSHRKNFLFDFGFEVEYFKKNYKYYEEWVPQWNPNTLQYEYSVITSHKSIYSWGINPIILLGYKF